MGDISLAYSDFTCCSCVVEGIGLLLVLALPSISCVVAPLRTIFIVGVIYISLPFILGCFWSVLFWSVCSVLVFLRLLQSFWGRSKYKDRSIWFRAIQLISMHDLSKIWFQGENMERSQNDIAPMHALISKNKLWPSKLSLSLIVYLFESLGYFFIGLLLWMSIPILSTNIHPILSILVRTTLTCCSMLVWLDSIDSFFAFGITIVSFGNTSKPDKTQNDPLRSLSIGEFWAQRWNTEMSNLLKEVIYFPTLKILEGHKVHFSVAQQIATIATFGMSGLLHAYIHFLLGRKSDFCSTMAFFLTQPIGMFVERQLKIRKWSTIFRRLWTFLFLLVTFPLLSEPMMRLLPPNAACPFFTHSPI